MYRPVKPLYAYGTILLVLYFIRTGIDSFLENFESFLQGFCDNYGLWIF